MSRNRWLIVAVLATALIGGGLIIYSATNHPTPTIDIATLQTEANTGSQSSIEAAKLVEQLPIIKELPYIEDTFRIDYGISNNEDSDATALYITYDSEQSQKKALEWLQQRNVDTNKIEIIYTAEQTDNFTQ